VRPDDTCVLAVDLGTTTVVCRLIDAARGTVLRDVTGPNLQAPFGADVLSRLSAALDGHAGELRDLAQQSILKLISDPSIMHVVIAANSVMAALLVGADASGLASAPFTPVRNLQLTAGPLRAALPDARITVLDPLAAFVGGDARAAAVACGLNRADGVGALIDLGTNAEVLLRAGDTLYVTSAAAGQAFAGGGGRLLPSRLLAGVVAAQRDGALGTDGRLDGAHASVERADSGVLGYRWDADTLISQLLIRDLQLAKAAVRVALDTLKQHAGVTGPIPVSIAGALGTALDAELLLPLGFIDGADAGLLRVVGNAALDGAAAIACGRASGAIEGSVAGVDLTVQDGFARKLLEMTDFPPIIDR
jgi:uncharacterized 2Fe-2S/4Fe-4S cluster protein (DUF4445 family)